MGEGKLMHYGGGGFRFASGIGDWSQEDTIEINGLGFRPKRVLITVLNMPMRLEQPVITSVCIDEYAEQYRYSFARYSNSDEVRNIGKSAADGFPYYTMTADGFKITGMSYFRYQYMWLATD